MSYKVVQKVNNNHYLYEVTSTWDPEAKKSRQKRKYLGKCDEDGNLLTPKTETSLRVRDLGRCYIMYRVAMDMGLREKLVQAFGDDGNLLFTTCIHRSTRSSVPRHNIQAMAASMLPYLTGTDVVAELRDVSNTVALIRRNLDRVDDLFSRMDKGNDVLVFHLNSLMHVEPLYLDSNDPNKGVPEFPPLDLYLGVSTDPNNAFFYSIIQHDGQMENNLHAIDNHIRDLGPRHNVFYLSSDDMTEREANLMANAGVLFVKNVRADTELGHRLLTEYETRLVSEGTRAMFNNAVRTILDVERDFGDIRCRVVIINNDMQRSNQLNAFYQAMAKFEDTVSKMRWSADIKERAQGKFGLRSVVSMFDLERADNGFVIVKRREGDIREWELNLGKTIFVTNTDDPWNVLLSNHVRHNRFKNETEMFRTELQDGSFIMESLEAAVGTFLNEFLCISIRTHLSQMLGMNIASSNNTYVDVLNDVSDIHAVHTDDGWRVSVISPRQKALFDRLGVPVPTSEMMDEFAEAFSRRNSL